ncbi:MAG: hypothetical protein ACOX2W_03590 [Desulfomonilia bacterium]
MRPDTRYSYRTCIALLCIAWALLAAGCKRGDINLVKKSVYGNRETTIGAAFDRCSHFAGTSWDRIQYEANRPIVVFTAELPIQVLLNTVTADAHNWLTLEKTYFEQIAPQLAYAYIRITFPVDQESKTFTLGDVMLGIASEKQTAWSPAFSQEKKERIIQAIYEDSPDIFTQVAACANPSFSAGSTLLRTLTGKDISQAR